MTIERKIDVEISPTPEELAGEFWAMNGDDQAEFFNALGRLSGHMLCFQLQSVTDSVLLTVDGRHAMKTIGEYGEVVL